MGITFCIKVVKLFPANPIVVTSTMFPSRITSAFSVSLCLLGSSTTITMTLTMCITMTMTTRLLKFCLECLVLTFFMCSLVVGMVDDLRKCPDGFQMSSIGCIHGRDCAKIMGNQICLHLMVHNVGLQCHMRFQGPIYSYDVPQVGVLSRVKGNSLMILQFVVNKIQE